MKAKLGYYLETTPIGEIEVPIYGLRAVPTDICTRQWGDISYGDRHWQVEIIAFNDYVWINQARHLIFLY